MDFQFDVIIIGGGPGGTSASKTLARAGKKVALISTELGGECLNYGCIPTKIYLQAAELSEKTNTNPDWQQMKEKKTKLVEKLKKALLFTLETAGVKIIKGIGKFKDSHTIIVESDEGAQELIARYIIIATGSEPISLPGIELNGINILNNRQILELPEPPKNLLIIGGGVTSVEFASIFSMFQTEITIAEVSDRILRGADPDISAEIERVFSRKNIKILKNTRIQPQQIGDFEKVLIATGRKPAINKLNMENTGKKDSPNIFVIGDAAGKSMLAYTADREGRIAAEKILGKNPEPINYGAIPYTIFSLPEAAWVGFSEPELKQNGIQYITGKALMSANSKALITGNRDGFAKILADKNTGRILGIHIVGEKASELIAEATLAINANLTIKQFYGNIHSHPVLGEILQEACEKTLEMVE